MRGCSIPSGSRSMRWGSGILILATVLCVPACRSNRRFPSRGDAAAVVIVAPRRDAAALPRVQEQEPNDSPDQAQPLTMEGDFSIVGVEGAVSGPGEGK